MISSAELETGAADEACALVVVSGAALVVVSGAALVVLVSAACDDVSGAAEEAGASDVADS